MCSSVATMGVSVGYCLSSFWAARRGAGPSDVGVREALLELCCSSVPFEAPRMMLAAGWVQMAIWLQLWCSDGVCCLAVPRDCPRRQGQ